MCSLYHNHTCTRLSPTRPSPAFHCSIHHVLSFPPLPPQALTSPAAAAGRVGPSFAAGEEEEEEGGGGWQPRCPHVTKHLSDKWVQRERRSILVPAERLCHCHVSPRSFIPPQTPPAAHAPGGEAARRTKAHVKNRFRSTLPACPASLNSPGRGDAHTNARASLHVVPPASRRVSPVLPAAWVCSERARQYSLTSALVGVKSLLLFLHKLL